MMPWWFWLIIGMLMGGALGFVVACLFHVGETAEKVSVCHVVKSYSLPDSFLSPTDERSATSQLGTLNVMHSEADETEMTTSVAKAMRRYHDRLEEVRKRGTDT